VNLLGDNKDTIKKNTNSVASELYRPSDHHLSAKLVPTFADRGVSHGQCSGSPMVVILIDASKEVGLNINVEKTIYMLLSRHQNLG
jgi:hypothetical protein